MENVVFVGNRFGEHLQHFGSELKAALAKLQSTKHLLLLYAVGQKFCFTTSNSFSVSIQPHPKHCQQQIYAQQPSQLCQIVTRNLRNLFNAIDALSIIHHFNCSSFHFKAILFSSN
ncbi:hypothetical protein T4D_4700 [Trichinella pseudospiralis]|uniref:Uncharacterized protein n=1 Tax=Trichinella pseudospiralis TaxID=6337 RepID=A0A0V1F7J7_TRIPS|nr:hypothetical protein T4D_4700 [Trichinella pseudospiralis]